MARYQDWTTSEDDVDDAALLRIAREEAHRTVDSQLATLNDIDEKASRVLRLNLLLVSILVGGFSIATRGPGDATRVTGELATALWNPFTRLGLASLVGSTIVAAVTYTASNVRTGMSGRDVQAMVTNDADELENLEGLVLGYSRWIRDNFRTNTVNAPLGTVTVLLQTYSVVLVAAGAYHGLGTALGPVTWVVLSATFLLLAIQAGLVGQLRRYWRYRDVRPSEQSNA